LSRTSTSHESRGTAQGKSACQGAIRAAADFRGSLHLCALLSTLILGAGSVCHAGAPVPTDAHVGLFYAVTHLNPLAYVLLFLIVVLSVANLVVQGWLSRETWPFNRVFPVFGSFAGTSLRWASPKKANRTRLDSSLSVVQGGPDHLGGVVGAPRPVSSPEAPGTLHPPTPLDGVNHPIPWMSNRTSAQTGAPRIVESSAEKKTLTQDFRFSATVDLPSAEEVERREKEQLVVSGSVTGPDGRGIASSIVYLTDSEGNRIGQSCRTQAETGEFKVLVNQPGKYFVNVYKRGYVLENSDAMPLPIESGKIEGYRVRMIPEGCIVQGRVTTQGGSQVVPDIQVQCLCKAGDYSRSVRTDTEGRFKLAGIPINSECCLEVLRSDGRVVVRSNAFETVQRREIRQDLIIPVESLDPQSGTPDREKHDDKWTEKDPAEKVHPPAATSASA
jgi:hypothetical protein